MPTLMTIVSIILGIIVVIGVPLTPVWIAIYKARKEAQVLNELARRINGRTYGGSFWSCPNLTFADQGLDFDVRFESPSSAPEKKMMYLSGPWPGSETRITLFPESFWTRANKFMGLQDFQVGEPTFDNAFVVQGNSQRECMDLLQPDVQGMLINAWQVSPTISLSIAGGQLCLAVQTNMNVSSMTGTVSSFLDMRRRMLRNIYQNQPVVHTVQPIVQAELAEAKVKMSDLSSTLATCMVCGTKVTEYQVKCRRCKTPHHKDCWGYFGGCSRYGCGETVFLDSK